MSSEQKYSNLDEKPVTQLQSLRKNPLLRLVSVSSGLFVPVATLFFLYQLFGSSEDACWAVEHPDDKIYSEDPSISDYKNYAGLKAVNVSDRTRTIVISGMAIEGLQLLLVILGLAMGRGKVHDLVGHASLAWFFAVVWARYDHYGRVCSGDYLQDGDAIQFPNMVKAGEFGTLYIKAIWMVVIGLFSIVLLYSCCTDKPRKAPEEKEEE